MDTQAKDELESAGFDDSFWGTIIIQAEHEGSFSEEARRQSEDWTTCACGQQDPRLHDEDGGTPLDRDLVKLGLNFEEAVADDDFLQAALTLIAIERTAIELLAGLDK